MYNLTFLFQQSIVQLRFSAIVYLMNCRSCVVGCVCIDAQRCFDAWDGIDLLYEYCLNMKCESSNIILISYLLLVFFNTSEHWHHWHASRSWLHGFGKIVYNGTELYTAHVFETYIDLDACTAAEFGIAAVTYSPCLHAGLSFISYSGHCAVYVPIVTVQQLWGTSPCMIFFDLEGIQQIYTFFFHWYCVHGFCDVSFFLIQCSTVHTTIAKLASLNCV